MVLRDMKKVSFCHVINRAIESGLITSERLFFSLRDSDKTLDVGLITAVYRMKPDWLESRYSNVMPYITKWYGPSVQGNGKCQLLQWITPLGLAVIKGDKKLEKLLVRLGADTSCVAGFLFKQYSAQELLELVCLRG